MSKIFDFNMSYLKVKASSIWWHPPKENKLRSKKTIGQLDLMFLGRTKITERSTFPEPYMAVKVLKY
jgi:hypothetical protein